MNRIIAQQALAAFALAASLIASPGPGTLQAAIPRPEHPRPDAFRENWMSLNGEWQFEIDTKADGEARGLISGKDLSAKILVPFCPESRLSGVGHYDHMQERVVSTPL